MNSDMFKGKWLQIRGAIKERWGDLTDDDLTRIDGNMDRLAGVLQERYGYTRERAQQEIERFTSEGDYNDMGDTGYGNPRM
jgi:uncharacterized protein YjbJ (UPF0337 family)